MYPIRHKKITEVDLFDQVFEVFLDLDKNLIFLDAALFYVSQDADIYEIMKKNINFDKCVEAESPIRLRSVLKDLTKRISDNDEPTVYAFLFIWDAFKSKKFSSINENESNKAQPFDIILIANKFFKWLLDELTSNNMPKQLDYINKSVMKDQLEEVLGRLPLEENKNPNKPSFFPADPGTKWNEVIISLIDLNKVKISMNGREKIFTYKQMQMVDKRNNNDSKISWKLLVRFLLNEGVIHNDFDYKFIDGIKLFKSDMKNLFNIDEELIPHYKKAKKYKVNFMAHNRSKIGKESLQEGKNE